MKTPIRIIINAILLFIFFRATADAQHFSALTFTSSNLPIVVINTHGQVIVDEPKITADMGIIYNGVGQRNYLTDSMNHYNGKIGIEIRGSSSQMFPKKQYGVETRDSSGGDLSVSLLGFPSESDWILFAPYNDKSLMRDVLAYSLARSTGRYASRSHYCELVLNGEYMGLYVLLEKVKRNKNRINISKLDSSGTTGDNLTGGYMLKVDKLDGSGNDGWYSTFLPYPGSAKKILYQYHYPKPEDIVTVQKSYIQSVVLAFETTMNSSSYTDTANGYAKYIDINSAIDYLLVNELSKNVDTYRLSAYLYKDKDSKNGKLFVGPVWDFNNAFGNCDYYNASVIDGWQFTYLTTNANFLTTDNFQVPFWWKRLYQDTLFMKKVSARWLELRKTSFTLQKINGYIDSLVTYLDESQKRNFEKWPVLNIYVWPNAYIGGTYEKEILYLKSWIKYRIDWIDTELTGTNLAVQEEPFQYPSSFALSQNFPNPFNPATVINYQLPVASKISLKMYDVLGREVATLVDAYQSAGLYNYQFSITNYQLTSGLYFYKLNAGNFSETKKMMLLK